MKKSWWLEFFIILLLTGGVIFVLRQRSRTPMLVRLGTIVLPADVVQSGTGHDKRGDHLYALCADGTLYEFALKGRRSSMVPLVSLGYDLSRLTSSTWGYPYLRGWDGDGDGVEEVALAAGTRGLGRPSSVYSIGAASVVGLVFERDANGRYKRHHGLEKRWERLHSEWRQELVNPNPRVDGKPFRLSSAAAPFTPPPNSDWLSRLFPALDRLLRRRSGSMQEVTVANGAERRTIGKIEGMVAWVIDLDGDGNDEIVTYNFTRLQSVAPSDLEYHLYRYDGGKFREVWRDKFLEHQGNSTFIVDISDLDGDGMKELVFIEPANQRGIVMGLSPRHWRNTKRGG
jgi:hypothetical protein